MNIFLGCGLKRSEFEIEKGELDERLDDFVHENVQRSSRLAKQLRGEESDKCVDKVFIITN